MHYKIKDVNKYVEMLTQFVYEENPPKNILLFEIKNKTVIENIIDKFPTTNFYVIDEPYFLNIMLDERYRGGKYTKRILDCEKLKTEQDVTKEELLGALESILKRIEVEDLVVIMNPPYGKRASIARKVVNYILESCPKVSELTCLSPIRSNYDHWNDIESIAGPYSWPV